VLVLRTAPFGTARRMFGTTCSVERRTPVGAPAAFVLRVPGT
jgi:hypothetical protein